METLVSPTPAFSYVFYQPNSTIFRYVTNKYRDSPEIPNDSGGGLGFGLGFGLEFPIKLKECYIGTEFLFHSVNFHDKFTQNFQPLETGGFGYDDLTGNVYSFMVSYTISW